MNEFQEINLKKLENSTDKLKKLTADNPEHFKTSRLGKSMTNYSNQLEREVLGKRRRNRVFPYGTLVYVDFGINFGSEFSAPHYSITLTKEDKKFNNTITVLPLTSKPGLNNFELDDSISRSLAEVVALLNYDFIENNQGTLIDELGKLILPLSLLNPSINEEIIDQENKSEANAAYIELKARFDDIYSQIKANEEIISQSKQRLKRYMKDLDKTTYAKLDAITTIDKAKIFKSQNRLDPLGKIKLSSEQLQKISNEIAARFLFDADDK